MTKPIINGFLSTSNYFSPKTGENENLCLAGINIKKNDFSLSLGAGADMKHGNGIEPSYKPSFEAKATYNIGNYLNTQARFREIGDTQQYRVTFGAKYPINDKLSIYTSAHATTKKTKDNPLKTSFGAWAGATYNVTKALSLSAEIQQNAIPNQHATLSNPDNLLANVMVSYKF